MTGSELRNRLLQYVKSATIRPDSEASENAAERERASGIFFCRASNVCYERVEASRKIVH